LRVDQLLPAEVVQRSLLKEMPEGSVARGIRHTVFSRRSKVGRVASSAYRIAQGMNQVVDVSLPVPQAESMKRTFSSRRRKPVSQPAPVPQT
jgi:hypothetical protein